MNEELWKRRRLLDKENEASKLGTKLMREIALKLGENIDGFNIDDFEFAVTDSKSPDASCMRLKLDVKDGSEVKEVEKNLLSMTAGMMNYCNTEDELAGIIAHELGHYRWDKTNCPSDTGAQEHAADIWAIGLLSDAGYDPSHFVNINKKHFDVIKLKDEDKENQEKTAGYILSSGGVHGSFKIRLENMESAIADRLAQGAVLNTNNTHENHDIFKKSFNNAYEKHEAEKIKETPQIIVSKTPNLQTKNERREAPKVPVEVFSAEAFSYVLENKSFLKVGEVDYTANVDKIKNEQMLWTVLETNPELSKNLVQFLKSPTPSTNKEFDSFRANVENAFDKLNSDKTIKPTFDNESIKQIHTGFGNRDLSTRALVMNRLVSRCLDIDKQRNNDKSFSATNKSIADRIKTAKQRLNQNKAPFIDSIERKKIDFKKIKYSPNISMSKEFSH